MKIYVAGSGAERERVRAFAEALEAAGHEITHAWWSAEAWRPGVAQAEATDASLTVQAEATDASLTDGEALRAAVADLRGIHTSDCFILLRNRAATTFGAAFEAGVAASTGIWGEGLVSTRRLVVVGSRAPIFLRPWEHYETDEAALAALAALEEQ